MRRYAIAVRFLGYIYPYYFTNITPMAIIKTPEARFKNIKNYPFKPNYVEVDKGLNMHFVDEGPKDANPVLMLHGEPTWSYLYRNMIPICVKEGHRVIVPDLIGFGKSDKFDKQDAYTYEKSVKWMTNFIIAKDLKNITLVCQDWGSLIGLRVAAENEERFARIVIGNGGLPTGEQALPFAFTLWRTFAKYSPFFPIGKLVKSGSFKVLSDEEVAAYDAPFPTNAHKAGSRAFPKLVPASKNDPAYEANTAAWEVFKKWEKPFVTCFSSGDPITRGGDKYFKKMIPGTKGMPHVTLKGGHFLQENSPVEFANKVNEVIKRTS
jgi:haloalkane dehalogenase